jgi:hypothetical protein
VKPKRRNDRSLCESRQAETSDRAVNFRSVDEIAFSASQQGFCVPQHVLSQASFARMRIVDMTAARGIIRPHTLDIRRLSDARSGGAGAWFAAS